MYLANIRGLNRSKEKRGKIWFVRFKKHRKPETFHSDKGTEITNRKFQALLKKEGIRFFSTPNETKASIVERFNRTLKGKMWKYFTANNTLKYMDILQKLVNLSPIITRDITVSV
jgi:transposase InsO family protein